MNLDRRHLLQLAATTAAAAALPAAQPASAAIAWPGPAPLLHLPSRRRTSLDGPWHYIIDPLDSGARGNNVRRTFWKDDREGGSIPLVEYDWAASPVIDLPRDWNSHLPELLWYDGPVYFQRRFEAAPMPGQRRLLCFEAVNYAATVWLNGVEIGRHEGGFTPFSIDVTDRLQAGSNRLTVRADSRHGAEAVPTRYTDWQNYGGITRSVWLVAVPQVHIADWFIRIERGRIVADISVSGAGAGTPVMVSIGKLALRGMTDANGQVRIETPLRGLALWTPERPVLHAVAISIPSETLTDRIGLRTITTHGRELRLNDKPIFLRGISLHEEPFGPVGTRRMTEADARRLLGEAKALGCNFIRLAHYPHAETTLRIADEIGLIVWAEVPVYWEDIAYDSPRTLALARDMLGDMIRRDRNRASIGLWSVANETPATPERTNFLRVLIAHARALDPTRLLTAALNKNIDVGGAAEGESRFVVDDALGRDLDVLAINQYEAWYSRRTPADLDQVSFTSPYDKPLMFSEFGADARFGTHGPRDARWTEEYQAWLFEETIKLIERTPGCVGMSPWLLKDFRSPRRWHAQHQNFWNRKGVMSETGERKLAFDVLRRFYAAKAT
jgi:beta-glucuronidase